MIIPFALSIIGLVCGVVALLYGIRQKQLNDELHRINKELDKELKARFTVEEVKEIVHASHAILTAKHIFGKD